MTATHASRPSPSKPLTDLARFDRVLRPLPARRRAEYRISRLAALALGTLGCNLPAPEPTPSRAIDFILDNSTSAMTDRCAELGADLATALSDPAVIRLDIAVLALSDRTSGFEPKTIIPHDAYVAGGDLLEDPEAARSARVACIDDVVGRCDERLQPTPMTPLYLATKRGAEAFVALCDGLAQAHVACKERELRLHSDCANARPLESPFANVDEALCGNIVVLQQAPDSPTAARRGRGACRCG